MPVPVERACALFSLLEGICLNICVLVNALKDSFPFLEAKGIHQYTPLDIPQQYSISSPANSAWNFGLIIADTPSSSKAAKTYILAKYFPFFLVYVYFF